jgi:hypothetical protein
MAATPTPVNVPPVTIFQTAGRPMPTVYRPRLTITTATPKLAAVTPTSYRTTDSGTSKPSIAMKCMSQMPVPPIATAAIVNQRTLLAPVDERDRSVSVSPSRLPRNDSAYASTGLIQP